MHLHLDVQLALFLLVMATYGRFRTGSRVELSWEGTVPGAVQDVGASGMDCVTLVNTELTVGGKDG